MDQPAYARIPGRFGIVVARVGETAVSCELPVEPGHLDGDGVTRPAAIMMAVDMAVGLSAGFGVTPDWTMTADTAIQFIDECRMGPLRVDAHCVKRGRTQVLAEARVVDAGADDALIALATASHGVLTPDFENELTRMAIGDRISFPRPPDTGRGDLETQFGIRVDADGVSIPVDERTRNPWGILHGGLTGLVVEVIARSVGVAPLEDVVLRFLRPVRVGPGRARVVEELTRRDRHLLRVEMYDEGGDRVASVAHVVGRRSG